MKSKFLPIFIAAVSMLNFSCTPGSSLAAAAASSRDVTHIERSIISEMTVEGYAPPCSRIVVDPPTVIADFSGKDDLGAVFMEVAECEGVTASRSFGKWEFDDPDSWRTRNPLSVGSTVAGGKYRCTVDWWIDPGATGPVEFFALWKIIPMRGC